ncbi:MAG: 4Fe-4S dicluster domain-containing protein [Planctomycetota bacterium]|nr:4Fe-4S dicluster domain-containing protein [Planctomycetota bacterium]
MRMYRIRRLAALLVLLVFVAVYALDAPGLRAAVLTAQVSPAFIKLFHGAAATAVVLFAVTALFGRVYCAVLCPAGTLQDIFFRLGRRLKLVRSRYMRVGNAVGYAPVMVLAAVLVVAGYAHALVLFEPIGWFGRLTAPLLGAGKDIVLGTQNILGSFGAVGTGLVVAVGLLVVVPLFFGRRFCSHFCLAGMGLGLAGALSLRRIRLDDSACVSCGKCESVCPAQCIDSKGKRVESGRCVLCFACVPSCPTRALSYSAETSPQRRDLLAGGVSLFGAAVFFVARAFSGAVGASGKGSAGVIPPGAGRRSRYYQECVGCQSCVVACPVGIVKPRESLIAQPELNYDLGYCQYSCTQCTLACPTGALAPLSVADKQTTRIADTRLMPDRCVVLTEGTACGACAEVCPTHAATMEDPGDGTPTRPVLYPGHCIGCGACYHVCPATPRAFAISGLAVHERALPMREEGEGLEVDAGEGGLTDFPF